MFFILRQKNKEKFFWGRAGFTLLETLVAIGILSVAIVAPLTIAWQGIADATYARSQAIATYLAQDAVEYIINKKRQTVININNGASVFWLDGFTPCYLVIGKCDVDTAASDPGTGADRFAASSCTPGSCTLPPLQYSPSLGLYGYSASHTNATDWQNTPFTRSVTTERLLFSNLDEARVNVTVSWNSNLVKKSFTVRSNIFNTAL